jgi:hypothetical protein
VLTRLPDDIEAEWHARLAKAFGRVVVEPLHGPEALAALAVG